MNAICRYRTSRPVGTMPPLISWKADPSEAGVIITTCWLGPVEEQRLGLTPIYTFAKPDPSMEGVGESNARESEFFRSRMDK